MLLAAGLGTRLRPYTNIRPKPLFPVLNVPLLHILLDNLVKSGCERVVVNCHHLAEQIQAAVAERPEVIIQHEPVILGTGGSLRKALPLFSDDSVLVMNGDIYHDIDVGQLFDQHHAADPSVQVTMAIHDYPRFNSVLVQRERVCGFSQTGLQNNTDLLAFTGIHVINRAVIEQIPENTFFHIIDLYQQLAEQKRVAAVRVDNNFWHDIGSPKDYLDLHRHLLADQPGSSWCIHDTASIGEDVSLQDWGTVGANVKIGAGVQLRRCVVWENVEIVPGERLTDMICYAGN